MLSKPFEILTGIYCVGGSDISHPQDALVYLIKGDETAVLIDAGAGKGSSSIWENIQQLGVKPQELTTLLLTHGHVDHIGGRTFLKKKPAAELSPMKPIRRLLNPEIRS